MSKVRVYAFAMSIDGFSAGPNQSLENPLGENGGEMFGWFFNTRTFKAMHGGPGAEAGGETGIDDGVAARGFENIGAWILGRNMFGPVRGPWPDDSWKGWWGDEPPYHVPAFVLTHHARAPLPMQGGTTFHFVTDGIRSALRQAQEAAGSRDVRIGGGVATIRQYLEADLIDEMHLVQSTAVLGCGEALLHGIDLRAKGFRCVERVAGERATHLFLRRS